MKSILTLTGATALMAVVLSCYAQQSTDVLIKNMTGNPIRLSCETKGKTTCYTTNYNGKKSVHVTEQQHGKYVAENGARLVRVSSKNRKLFATINIRQHGKHNKYPIVCAFDVVNASIKNVDNRSFNCVETTIGGGRTKVITVQ